MSEDVTEISAQISDLRSGVRSKFSLRLLSLSISLSIYSRVKTLIYIYLSQFTKILILILIFLFRLISSSICPASVPEWQTINVVSDKGDILQMFSL